MKASELRLGNWLMNQGTAERVHELSIERGVYFDNDLASTPFSMLKPIELTPELLDKIGFGTDINGDMAYEVGARIWIWFNKGNVAEMDIFQDGKNISFKCGHILYVHQLQNFYFALANKELDIKL